MKSLIITTMITIATFGSHLSGQSLYGTSTNVGSTTYHSLGNTYGTSTNVGSTTYHSLGNTYGTSTSVGSTTYHSFSKWPK